MASVTIPGASPSIVETFGNQANLQLANQIRDVLANAGSNLKVTPATPGGGLIPGPPSNTPAGAVNELVINDAGSYTITAGSASAPDYVVVVNPTITGGVAIHGTANSTILGGNSIVDAAVVVLPEGAGNAAVIINGFGEVVAGNNQNDTLTAAGFAGSIAGGTGTNLFRDLGANDIISAQGSKDTIFGGPNSATIQLLGKSIYNSGTPPLTTLPGARNALVVGGNGSLAVTDAGSHDTIIGGSKSGALDVTLSGSAASVVGGSFASLFVTDNGIGDTITAGAGFGFTSVSAATSSAVVVGGTGALQFVGGAGNSTIMGGSGNSTIFGGTGLTQVVGGAGGAMEYVNTTAGGVYYQAGSGNETIDASLSKGANTIFGALTDPTGQNLLMGGAGAENFVGGKGADTLVGNGGQDSFFFFTSYGSSAANHVISDFSFIDRVLLMNYGTAAAGAAIC
jgi:RTX calcium-binding nonapeptide repeat (4 copies)